MQPSDPYGLVGQVLDGQFRVDRPIGEGGFSVVYRGKHLGLGEPIAIKCLKLPPRLGSAIVENFIRRFRDESKIQYKLSQTSLHIVRTIAAGTAMAPSVNALVPFMVLEWLEGYPLAEELRARRERGETGRPLESALRLLDPVAEALAMAHGMGVVHRDLNPSNIFLALDAAGGNLRPKVMDFGVAKVVSDHALALGPRTATLNQLRLFTPPYGAPEQFDDRIGPIATSTDVYSFALVMVELLTDRPPNEGDDLMALMAQACDASKRPTPLARGAAVSEAVEEVFARALSVDPGRRPVDVGEFWGNLKHAAAGGLVPRLSGSHTAKGTFILSESPFSTPPATPPAFALPLSKPAQGSPSPHPPAPALTASWHSPPVLPPLNDADTWHSPAGASPNGARSPSAAPRATPDAWPSASADAWGKAAAQPASPNPGGPRGDTQGDWGGGPPTVLDRPSPIEHYPDASVSPLAETGPAGEPTSHVDPFGPTAEGVEARPGASPLSITVKPGERRPEFFIPASKAPQPRVPGQTPHSGMPLTVPERRPAHTPNAGMPLTVPERRPAHTPNAGSPPLRTPAPTPGGGVSHAASGAFEPHAHATPTASFPGGSHSPPFGSPAASPAPGHRGASPSGLPPTPYAHAPAGHTAQGHSAPPYPPPQHQHQQAAPGGHYYAPPPAPPVLYSPRPAPPEPTNYGLPSGQVPLRALEGSGAMAPMPATPSHLPPEPVAQPENRSALKPMLAWSLVVLALAAALGGIAYAIALYVRHT